MCYYNVSLISGDNMKSVYEIINILRSDNSRLFKEKVMQEHKENISLRNTFLYAIDPSKQYHIKKIPAYHPGSKPVSLKFDDIFPRLDRLSRREVTGHAAIEFLKETLESLSVEDAHILERIIKRDLDCGASGSIAEKTWSGLIAKPAYMRCSGYALLKKIEKKIDWARGVFSQLKSDGTYASITFHEKDVVTISTRSGKILDSKNFPAIVKQLNDSSSEDMQYHGELLVIEDGVILPRQTGNGILTSVQKGGSFGLNQEPKFVCWDAIPASAAVKDGRFETPYHLRYGKVSDMFLNGYAISAAENKILHSMEEVLIDYADKLARGEEGIIVKLPDAIWVDGDSREQFKVKLEFAVELKAKEMNPANEGQHSATFGSILCESSDGLLTVSISGMSKKVRKEIFDNWDTFKDSIVEVTANCIMKPKKVGGKYSLFLPRWSQVRNDKTEADSLERIQEQYDSLVNPNGK